MQKLLATALVLMLGASSYGAERRPMTPKDVVGLKQAAEPQISPDGNQVVFSVRELDEKDNLYQSDLWLVGATSGEPVRLTYHPKNDTAPAWSPDGNLIAFLSEREEKAQVFVMSARGGEPWRLTEAKAGVAAFSWAADATAITYLAADAPSEEEEKKEKAKDDERVIDEDFKMVHLWKVTLADKKAVRLTEGAFTLSDPQWSPDGREIAVVRNPTPKPDDGRLSDILIVPAAGGTPRILYANDGPEGSPRWSPDGKQIAFLSRDGKLPLPGTSSLYVIPAQGGSAKQITDADLNPGSLSWSPDGRTIWFTAGQGLRGVIASAPAGGGRTAIRVEGPFVASSPSLARRAGTIAYLRQNPESPNDVWVEPAGGAEKAPAAQRTRMNAQVSELLLGQAKPWRWKSTDGREMEGVLYLPADYAAGKRVPLLVEAHGGPSGAYTLSFPGSWSTYSHCYAGRGWGVFQPNFRGSSNYGDGFLRLNVRDWGGGDFQDIMSGVDDLVARGIADSERMAFHGWSYGGYLTAWTITQTARFKAAACGAGLTNMFSMYSTNDLQRTLEDYFGGEPWDDNQAYHRASALYHIKQARTPTLILHGEKDERVPIGQAQELYMGLKKNGVPVSMVIFPREPHGLREPNHQLDKMEREMAWFERYVLGSGAPTPTNEKDD